MSIKDLVPRLGRPRLHHVARREEEDVFLGLQREVNRLFEDFFNDFDLAPHGAGGWRDAQTAAFHPRVDLSETDKDVTISAELPGMDEKDIHVELDDAAVKIRGEKKEEKEEKNKNWFRRELSYGSFNRVVPLPATVESEKAKAKFRKGILTITVPKRKQETAARRTVHIESD